MPEWILARKSGALQSKSRKYFLPGERKDLTEEGRKAGIDATQSIPFPEKSIIREREREGADARRKQQFQLWTSNLRRTERGVRQRVNGAPRLERPFRGRVAPRRPTGFRRRRAPSTPLRLWTSTAGPEKRGGREGERRERRERRGRTTTRAGSTEFNHAAAASEIEFRGLALTPPRSHTRTRHQSRWQLVYYNSYYTMRMIEDLAKLIFFLPY